MASQNVSINYTLVDKVSKQAGKIARTLGALEQNANSVDRSMNTLSRTQSKDMVKALSRTNRLLEEQDRLIEAVRKQTESHAASLKKEFDSIAKSRTKESNARRKAIKAEQEYLRTVRVAAEAVSFLRDQTEQQINAITRARSAIFDAEGAHTKLLKRQRELASSTSNLSNLFGKNFKKSVSDLRSEIDSTVGSNERLIRSLRAEQSELISMSKTLDMSLSRHREFGRILDAQVGDLDAQINALMDLNRGYSRLGVEVDSATPKILNMRQQFGRFSSAVNTFTAGRGKIRKAFREAFDLSFFRSGLVQGLGFIETQTKLLGLLPVVAVAVGGLASAFGSLGAGITMAAGSLTRLMGGLAVLPGMYAALGAGFLGVQNIFTGFITPAVNGAKQLEGMGSQISAAQARLAKANADVAASQTPAGGPVSFGEAMEGKFGMAAGTTDPSKAESALEAQKQAQQQLTDLTKQQADLLEKMPKDYQKIADAVEGLQAAWKNFFQGGERGEATTKVILDTITAMTNALGEGSPLIKVAEEYVKLYQDIGGAIQSALDPKSGNLNIIATIWLGAVKNARKFVELMRVLGPYIAQVMMEINKFTGRVLDTFISKVRSSQTSAEEFGASVGNFLDRAYDSWSRLFTAIGNVVAGYQNLINKTKDESGIDVVDRLELGLVDITETFKDWTATVDSAKVNSYFNNSIEILKSIGRLLLSIGKAMGMVVSDDAAAKSTVDFFDQLGKSIEKFGGFMAQATGGGLGDKMTGMLKGITDAFSGKGGGIIRSVERAITIFEKLITVFDMMPPWVLEFFLTLRLGAWALGLTLGSILGPLSSIIGKFINLETVLASIKKINIGASLTGASAAIAGSPKKAGGAIKRGAKAASGAVRDKVASTAAASTLAFSTAGGGAKGVGSVAKMFASLMNPLKVIGPLLRGTLGLLKAFGPIGLIITAVVGAVMALKENFMGVTDSVKNTVAAIKGQLGAAFSKLAESLGFGGKGGGKGWFSTLLDGVEWLSKVLGVVLVKSILVVANIISTVLATAVNILAGIINTIKAPIENIVSGFKLMFDGNFAEGAKKLGKGIFQAIAVVPRLIWSVLKSLASGLKDLFFGIIQGLGDSLLIFIGGAIETLIQKLPGQEDFTIGAVDAARGRQREREAQERAAKIEEAYQKDRKKDINEIVSKYKDKESISAKIADNERKIKSLQSNPLAMKRGGAATVRALQSENSLLADAKKEAPTAASVGRVAAPATQADAGMTVQQASQLPGVTSGPKGAVVKWDMGSVQAFTGQINVIKEKTRELVRAITALVNHIRDYPMKNLATIMAGWKLLADQIEKPFKDLFGENGTFYQYLKEAITSANSVLTAAGQDSVSATINGEQVGGSSGTGDSRRPPTTAAGGGAASSGNAGRITSGANLIAQLDDSIEESARALINGWTGQVSVNSTLRDYDTVSGPGISQHTTGMAMDLSPQPWSTEAANRLGRWIQNNASTYGVNPNQVFYPANDPEHYDHVHVGFGGTGSFADMSNLPEVPNFGSDVAGRIATALATSVREALTGLGGSGGNMDITSYAGDHSALDKATPAQARGYAQAVLSNWGWGADQMAPLNQLWNEESGWRWNADNPTSDAYGIPQALPGSRMASAGSDWQTNAGTQIDWGLWYIKQGANTTKSKPGGGYGSPSDALAAKNSTNPRWYGNGGSFTAKKPMMIGVGDKQPEEVRVTPTRGPNKGKYSGGKTTVVNSTINLGTLIANESGIEMLTEEIGKQIRKDISSARRAKPVKDE